MKHSYFVSYFFKQKDGTTGYGHVSANSDVPMGGASDIAKLVEFILEKNPEFDGVVPLSWQRFEQETPDLGRHQVNELENHRVHYQRVKAAGFKDPDDLLAAYQALKRRHDGLRKLCGYVENGSDTTVTLFQDDATRDWVVKVGSKSYCAGSFNGALERAIAEDKDEG